MRRRTCASRDPQVELLVETESADDLMRRLASGEIEVSVLHQTGAWPHLATAELYRAGMHVILAADHGLADRDVVPVEELVDEPLILLETPPSAPQAMAYLHTARITARIVHRSAHFKLVRSLTDSRFVLACTAFRTGGNCRGYGAAGAIIGIAVNAGTPPHASTSRSGHSLVAPLSCFLLARGC